MKDIILTHGALGSAAQMSPMAERLAPHFRVHVLEWHGHGTTELGPHPFSVQGFSDQLYAFIAEHDLVKPYYLGYSMGGYIGLEMESRYPGTLGKIMTFATKYAWNAESAAHEAGRLNPVRLMEKVPQFAKVLQERHSAVGWEHHLALTATLMRELGRNSVLHPQLLATLRLPVICGVGDRDTMVGISETQELAAAIPESGFYVLPGTEHPIEKLDEDLIVSVARYFFRH